MSFSRRRLILVIVHVVRLASIIVVGNVIAAFHELILTVAVVWISCLGRRRDHWSTIRQDITGLSQAHHLDGFLSAKLFWIFGFTIPPCAKRRNVIIAYLFTRVFSSIHDLISKMTSLKSLIGLVLKLKILYSLRWDLFILTFSRDQGPLCWIWLIIFTVLLTSSLLI